MGENTPQAKVIVSRKRLESIQGHFHKDWDFQAVKTGDTVSLGETAMAFVEAPMPHGPDSMLTYLSGRNLLMPNDAFGQHYATAFRFNDREELYHEAFKYYANILTPFSPWSRKRSTKSSRWVWRS
ncbi:MAG: hypothetical protein Q7I97_08345 [Thermovirgaceae bacterium]|nr:hypothetical protein [Thermovirgaceae bacterium]